MGVIEDVHEQLRLELAKLGGERKALDSALKAVQQALDALDGQAMPSLVPNLAGPTRKVKAAKRKLGRPQKVKAPIMTSAAPAKRRGRPPRKAVPPTGPLAPIAPDTPGALKTPSGRAYRICPNCKKRTETNPCHVCGDKMVIVKDLRSPAPIMDEDGSRDVNGMEE